jgi:outer membrane lipoprotein SlyB
MIRAFCLFVVTVFAVAGCAATDPATGSRENTVISVSYGTVQQVEQVKMDPNYAGGALLGGGIGLAAASRRSGTTQAGAAIAGALIGALIQKHRAGMGDRYTILLTSGATIEMITEHHDIAAGDCVSVEQGKHANIRRVSPVMCNTAATSPGYAVMHAANVTESQECHAVKEELMAATTESEADLAYKKMRAFCEQ